MLCFVQRTCPRGLRFRTWNQFEMNEYILKLCTSYWTSVSTVGLSERGLNLGYLTCSLMAMCYVLCRELFLGFWGSEPETNLTVGLSERGLNLGYLTCSLMAMCYVLCRELVLGFRSLELETNLKWVNIYWSYAPPVLNVRLDCRSVWEGSELGWFYM